MSKSIAKMATRRSVRRVGGDRADGAEQCPRSALTARRPSRRGGERRGGAGFGVAPDGSVVRPDAAGITRTAPDPITVRRPDGTVVHSRPDVQPPQSSPATDARADERERMRQQAQQAAEERIERSRREREAAGSSPARQVAPTSGR